MDLNPIIKTFGDAALDAGGWQAAMDTIARETNSVGACLFPLRGVIPIAPSSLSLQEANAAYVRDGWYQRDMRVGGAKALASRGVATDLDAVSYEVLLRHPYWQEWLRPHGLMWATCVKVAFGDELWSITLQRSEAQGMASREDLRTMGVLSEHLGAAAALSRALSFARLEGMMQALESSETAILLIDRLGKVFQVNRAAERLLGDGWTLREGTVMIDDKRMEVTLHRAITACLNGDPADGPARVSIPRRNLPPLMAYVGRPSGQFADVTGPCQCIVTIMDLFQKQKIATSVVRETLGLTEAESKVAVHLFQCADLSTAAAELGISYETARTQLKSVFSKTGVRSQGELFKVLSLLSSSPRLIDP